MTINCNQPPRYTTSAAERSCHFDIKHSIELSQQITVADLMGHQSTQETAGRQQPYKCGPIRCLPAIEAESLRLTVAPCDRHDQQSLICGTSLYQYPFNVLSKKSSSHYHQGKIFASHCEEPSKLLTSNTAN